MSDDVDTDRDPTVRDKQERSDAVAASAEPQGDGTPDDAAAPPEAAAGTGRTDAVARALEEQRERHLRLAAEYDNFRKRSARERQEAGTRAQGELLLRVLDSLDDLARVTALDPASTDAASVIHGVELVEQKLLRALAAAGLEVIAPLHEPFNPELHEAVGTAPALSPEDDHLIAQVYQPGYRFGGQLLRPARVVVQQWNG